MNTGIKVVLHVMAGDGPNDMMYGNDGGLKEKLQELSGLNFKFVSFCNQFLEGRTLDNFLTECKDAHVVIVDAWNHPTDDSYGSPAWENAYRSMANIVIQVKRMNPLATIFADLMEGTRKVAVHEYAEPIRNWTDEKIISAIMEYDFHDDRPTVLVFDDTQKHLKAAREQLSDICNLVITDQYERAEQLLQFRSFDCVLLDLLVPPSPRTLGPEGQKHLGTEMPLTPILAFLALSQGVKKVGILTDANHHNHPASAALDIFRDPFMLGDAKVIMSNAPTRDGLKCWDKLFADLS
jgi:hypothetical protein